MRVIAGTAKGRTLRSPRTGDTRPITDRAKESLFAILGPRIPGSRFLDLFAGTGSVGIEALSRGAAHVTFVEQDPRARGLIAENLSRCGLLMTGIRAASRDEAGKGDGYTIERGSAEDVLSRLEPVYDVVFLDPPYDEPDLAGAVTLGVGLLTAGGICVLEHASRRAAPDAAGAPPARRLASGDSALAFYLGPAEGR